MLILESMFRYRVRLVGMLLLLWAVSAVGVHAQEPQSATDLLQTGFYAYQNREWPKAEELLGRFASDYGKSAEAAQYMEKVLRLLALAQIQQKKFEEAVPNLDRYLKSYPQGDAVEEIGFWLGVARARSGNPSGARQALEDFIKKHPQSRRVPDAQLLAALTLYEEGKFVPAADYLQPLMAKMPPSLAGQAGILQLAALLEAGKLPEALTALRAFDPQSPSATRLSAFQLLALSLGDKLADKGEARPALEAYQRIWSKTRVLARQQGRLRELEEAVARAAADKGEDRFDELRLRDLAGQVKGDMENLEKIPDYDTALQFRIARAFVDLERFREAQLVLARMVEKLPSSEMLAQAYYQRLVCLAQLERWEEAIVQAEGFEKKFPGHKLSPNVAYFRAEALMRLQKYDPAAAAFADVASRFKNFSEAERCHFLAGYCQMMLDRNTEAVAHFDRHLEQWAKGAFREQVLYWQAMAYHYGKEYEKSREAHGRYLKEYPKGVHAADSQLRRAYALFARKDYTAAYKELETLVKDRPGTATSDEASNLLGDSYFAMGEIDRGIEAYRRTSIRDPRMFDYAWFRIGQAFKAQEQYDKQESHFREFLKKRADSPRLAEALGQLAAIHRRNGEDEKARNLYWEALREHGDNSGMQGIEALATTLVKMHRSPDLLEPFLGRLAGLEREAASAGKKTLAARALWTRAQALMKSQPDTAREWLRQLPGAEEGTEPVYLSPILLADAGDALREAGAGVKSKICYQTILRWHPRSLLKDRAYAGLGLLAEKEGERGKALEWFERFEKESVQSPLLAPVLQAKARILVIEGRTDEAIVQLGRILEIPSARGLGWVEALYRMGELHLKKGDPGKAVPHFQRIYVMYGRWSEYVAKSYWQSGQAFEKLQRMDEAKKTYQEFVSNTHLKDTPEYAKAEARLKEMGI
jgi:TolA-binding protein